MFLGLDASTQSISAILIDPESGKVVARESVNFGAELPQYEAPHGFIPGGKDGEVHADPRMWLEALDLLFARLRGQADLSKVRVISGDGQQHGSVYLDGTFSERLATLDPAKTLVEQLAPAFSRAIAPIWMDHSTSAECAELTATFADPAELLRRTGSVATERFTGPQIRRFFKTDPDGYANTRQIHLVSSFFASILAGKSAPIDPGDGAGMNLLNLARHDWDADLLAHTAPELATKLPPVEPTTHIHGKISGYFAGKYGFSGDCRVACFTGDNPASLVGMGASTPGNVVISLGTSDTWFSASDGVASRMDGIGHIFGNPCGGGMALVCFANGSLAREALRDELGVDWSAFEADALAASQARAGQDLMLPFYGPEITPLAKFSGPIRQGDAAFMAGENPARQIRALLEGQFLNMRLHAADPAAMPSRVRLTGGASRNNGIARIVADVLQAPVERLESPDSAALGSAILAAVAAGHALADLEAAFCQPVPGSRIEPDAALAPVYQDALARFASLLGERANR
ncbi:MAG: xylulokinase [Luteolibacter sp.]